METKQFWAAFCFALLTTVTAAATESQRAGPSERAAALLIEGAQAFTPEAIREALFNELDVVAACEPNAPSSELETVIADKTLAGYRAAGFVDVQVSVSTADDKLAMKIQQGDRYTNGEIDISGTDHLDADNIKARLTAPQADGLKRCRLWRAEEPAAFGPEAEARITSGVLAAANDQGCFCPKVKVTVKPDRNTKQATLHIDIRDEGPLSVLGDVDLQGNERDGREAVMAYLGIDAQAPLTRALREEIDRRLLASGRFLGVRWKLDSSEGRTASWRPRLILDEFDLAPPIDEPVMREEAALLKAAEWFEQLEQSDEEILFEQGGEAVVAVFAPRRGFLVMVKGGTDATATDKPGLDYAVVVDENRVGWYSHPQHSKLVAEPPPSPVTGGAIMNVMGRAPNWDSHGELTFEAGLNTETRKGYRRHVDMRFKLTAAAALAVVHKHKAKSRWDGEVVTFEWEKCQLRINADTGQLIEHLVGMGAVDDDATGMRMRARPGEFDRRLAEIESATADWPNRADAQRPVSCVCEFVCRELEHHNAEMQRCAGDGLDELDDLIDDDEPRDAELRSQIRKDMSASLNESYENQRRGYATLAKMISLGALEPVDKLAGHVNRLWEDAFPIPQPLFDVHAYSLKDFQRLGRDLAPIFGVRLGNILFAPGGSMNSAWRAGILAVAKKPIPLPDVSLGADPEQRHLLSMLFAAELLRAAGAEFESGMYALATPFEQATAFRNDCGELVSGEGFLSELLLHSAGVMPQLDAAEIEALFQLFVELDLLEQTQAAALEFAALRAHAEESPEQATAKALNALWRVGLSGWIERRLEELQSRPKKAVGL